MLAWWGIVPALAYVAIELVFNWPEAKGRDTTPGFAIGYMFGRFLFSFAIAMLVGWIGYRASHRSQRVGTIAFSATIGIMALVVLNTALHQRSPSLGLAQPSDKPVLAAFGAFEFEVPAGWSRVKPGRDKTQAMILLNPTRWGKADGELRVDVGEPTLPTAEQQARQMAGPGGKILPDPVLVDGAEGIRVETTATDLSKPRLIVIIYRGEKAYLIMAGTANGTDVSGAFDHVLKTWRWRDDD